MFQATRNAEIDNFHITVSTYDNGGFSTDPNGSVLGSQWGPSFSSGFLDFVSVDCNTEQDATDSTDCMLGYQLFGAQAEAILQQVTITKDRDTLQKDIAFGPSRSIPGVFNGADVNFAKNQDFLAAYSAQGFGFLEMTLPDPRNVNVWHVEPDSFGIEGAYVYDPALGENYYAARATSQGTFVDLYDTGLNLHDSVQVEGWPFSLSTSEDATRAILFSSRFTENGTELTVHEFGAFPDNDGDRIRNSQDLCPNFPLGLSSNPSSGLSAGTLPNHPDSDGNGIGDDCECGDQTGDGTVDVSDILDINAAIFAPALSTALCDASNDQLCDVNDILAVNAKIFGADAFCERYPPPGQ